MKLYAVTKGEYSNYHIITLTEDKKLAETLAKKFSDEWDDAMVEEFEDARIFLKNAYRVRFDALGRAIECESRNGEEYAYETDIAYRRDTKECFVTLVADNPEQAVKAAAEKRAKYLAQYYGL